MRCDRSSAPIIRTLDRTYERIYKFAFRFIGMLSATITRERKKREISDKTEPRLTFAHKNFQFLSPHHSLANRSLYLLFYSPQANRILSSASAMLFKFMERVLVHDG